MATIIQKPDTLSLSRNLKELIISTSSEISLQLLKGDSMLLEETYLPDVNNRVHVNLADIVTSSLSLTMPSGDAVSTFQSSVYSDFTVKVDGTSVAEFTAVRSGVERFSDAAANFLTANWLTWQPQVKEVLHDQPEWLTYYPASGSCACYARFYYTDGTSGEIKVCDVSQCVSINTRFSKLWALDESGKERYGVIDVYIKDAQGLRLTYVQRYVLCSQGALDEVYLCENSLGGLDTFRFYGDRKLVPEIGYTSLLLDNSYTAADPDLSRKWSQNTGMLTGRECEWCWELFRSSAAYHLYRGTILPIVLDASSVEKSAMSVLAAYSFDYRYASDLGLLNVVRSENLPEVVEISGPDAEVFFLTPRLNEFPSAVLSDDLIIPVQSPYEESWYTLSVGGLKSALLSSVETIYGPMWHEHDNLQVLNGLSVDSSGNLLYNGVQVGSGIVGAHDHHGETIRPEKIIVGDVEITCVDGRLHISKGLVSDGDIAAFGAEEGEEGGSGGLDIARLWEELAAEDASKVINVSHIPGSVVLQDELIEVLDDYPLTTEMNEALAGKAGKDWVEKELAKYLLLTGGKISGDLEVTGTLKIGEAVLSYQDGRLRISKGVVSDGDLAAFGAEEGEEGGSGGLDIARLWEELEAKDSTKVIDESHMPDSVVLQGELTGILEDYVMTVDMNTALAGKADLQHSHAIADVTGLQSVLNSKWEWDAAKVADVKVNNAVAADRLASTVNINGTPFNGESDIVTARWGTARTITVWDFYNVNKQAAQGVDGSANISLKLPQSIKVKTLSIDGVTLSVVGGRLHVDSTLTADGDLVAYGDEEGSSSSGGLDITRLWEELEAEDASKVIDESHLPSSVVLQDELTDALAPYVKTTAMNTALAGKAALRHTHAISEVTGLQSALNSKWEWNASQVAGVKVSNAFAADKLASSVKINGTDFNGESDIVTARWGAARTITVWDFYNANKQAAQGVDGSVDFSLKLPQSIKVKTLSIDGVTLSVVGGRLHVDSTLTADGDLVAYGDAEGSSGGGLDISRLWDELRADDSSKVIDLSHIPAIPTSKITGLDNALSGYVSSVTTSGAGNAVTGYAKSGNTLTLKKDLTFLTSVSLATISDLHSSWDALLKVAPTKYVTRWPTASEVGALTQTTADGRYLRLAGGTMTGGLTLKGQQSNAFNSVGLLFSGNSGRIGTNTNNSLGIYAGGTIVIRPDSATSSSGKGVEIGSSVFTYNSNTVLHSGNIGSYALTKSNYASTLDSRYVNVSGDTMTGPLKYISNGNRYLTLSEAGLRWDFSDVTGRHAHNWLRVTEPDGSSYAGMGVYGGTNGLTYLYLGGTYTAPWIALRPSGNVGIGITSPSYRLHVGGNAYVSGTIYASSSFNLTSNRGRFVFDGSSDATWLQGMAGKNMAISAMNAGTLPKLSLYADLVQASHDLAVSGSVKIGSITLTDSGGRLHVSSTVTSDGDFVAFGDDEGSGGSGGLDVARLWEELVAKDSSKIIDASHIPNIDVSKVTGLTASRALVSNASGKVAVSTVTSTELGYLDGVTSSIQTQLNGKVPTSRTINGIALSSNITLDGADIKLTGYTEGSSTAVVAATDTINAALAKLQNQIQTKAAASSLGSYLPKAGGTMTGDITMSGCSIRIPQSPSASSYDGILNADGSKAILAYYGESTYTGLMTGTHYLRSGASNLVHRRYGTDYAVLDAYNYTSYSYPTTVAKISDLHSSWDSVLTTSGVRSRSMTFNGTNYPCYTAAANTSNIAWYAPTTAGASGYVLQSTGGTPAWAAQNSLVVKGIYERSLGVAAGDTMADLKSALLTQMGSGLNKPGSMGYVSSVSVSNIMSNWANDDYKLVAGSRTNFLRLDGYGSSTYGVFLVSGYQGGFYRLLKNSSTAWGGPYLMLDTGNYTGTLDSRYLLKSTYTASDILTKLKTVDGSGSGLDADLLDGTHKSGLLTALTSNATTNLSLTVGGTVKTVADLYATYADKLRTARTIWGRSFNGEGNVSGAISSTGNITPSAAGSYNIGTAALWYEHIYGRYIDTASGYNLRLCTGGVEHLSIQASSGNVGIGTTSPAYKLDVAGTLRATGQGIFDTIKITDNTSAAHLTFGRSNAFNYISLPGDYSTLAIAPGGDTSGAGSALCISNSATYPGYHNGTISLGTSSYRWSNVYSVLGNFSGLVTAGSIAVTDKLYIPSSSGNNVFDAYIA